MTHSGGIIELCSDEKTPSPAKGRERFKPFGFISLLLFGIHDIAPAEVPAVQALDKDFGGGNV